MPVSISSARPPPADYVIGRFGVAEAFEKRPWHTEPIGTVVMNNNTDSTFAPRNLAGSHLSR
jgi:hypothetical protein